MADITTLKQQQTAVKKPTDFPSMLQAFLPEIKRALPTHLNGDRMARIALTCFRTTPKLGDCDPKSVFAAVIQASQLGLEPGIMGQAYLIPYGKQCNLIPGYQGLIELARRSGQITSLYAHVVRELDAFDYTLGTDKTLTHKPHMGDDAGEIIAAYAVAKLKDGGMEFEVMSRSQIDRIMRSTQSKGNSGPWKDHYEEMARKTVVRRLFKWLPKSVELASALALDDRGDRPQNLSVEDAIEGSYIPVDDAHQTTQEAAGAAQVAQGGFGFADAVAAVQAGDFDLAADIARSLPEGQAKSVQAAIASAKAPKAGNLNEFIDGDGVVHEGKK